MAIRFTIMFAACGLHAMAWVFPGAWYAVWLGQAGVIAVSTAARPRSAFAYGTLGGALGIAGSFYWGVAALHQTFNASPVMAWGIFSGLVALEGLGFGLFCFFTSLLSSRGIRWMWLIPCAWVATEYWFPRIFPWKIAYTQLEVIPLLQVADLAGSAAIGFLVTAIAAIPTVLWLGFQEPAGDDRRSALFYSGVAIAMLALALTYGMAQQQRWTRWCAAAPKLKLALIQVDPIYVGAQEKIRDRSLAVHDQVDLLVWPESAIGNYSEKLTHFRDGQHTQALSRQSFHSLEPGKDLDCHVLAGGRMYREGAPPVGPYMMTAFLVSPSDEILGRYMKRTLLPFGEYIPGQQWFPGIREYATIHEEMEAGLDPSPLVTASGQRFGLVICYEDTLPRNARHTVAAGAQALFSLIQGTAFDNPLTLEQHQRLALLRAVENRRYFVRCASTGVTCIIDPVGRVIGRLPPQVQETLLGEIALCEQRTLYNRVGDVLPWACTALLAVGIFIARRK